MMAKEEMRIAIAEKRGWSIDDSGHWKTPEGYYAINQMCEICFNHRQDAPPNYPEDLNACHEMEKVLEGSSAWPAYLMQLWKLTNTTIDWNLTENKAVHIQNHLTWKFKRATASQCCEAFCRVFWPEKFTN